jgi:hypothetical protein
VSAFWSTFFRLVEAGQNPHEFVLSDFSATRITTQYVLRNCRSNVPSMGLTGEPKVSAHGTRRRQ